MTEQRNFGTNTPEDRKAYHAPKLEDYGEVSVLTQASPVGYIMDSGSFPSNYSYTSPT